MADAGILPQKGRMGMRKIFACILALLLAGGIAFYVYGVAAGGADPREHLWEVLLFCVVCAAGIFRVLLRPQSRRRLGFYETRYAEQIKDAFSDSFWDRKKLLCAIRLYNENNNAKAVKYLVSLKPKCRTRDDFAAVGMFLALALTDMGLYQEAIHIYEQLIDRDAASSTLYSNLGQLYSRLGNREEAVSYLALAIQLDPKNAYAYNNLACLYFDVHDMRNAVKCAEEALALDYTRYEAASLLAIIFSVGEDREQAEKYFHMAIAGGQDTEKLKQAIAFYQKEKIADGPAEARNAP